MTTYQSTTKLCGYFMGHMYCTMCAKTQKARHGANMGPIWGRQDPGGPHVGPMNFAIWGILWFFYGKSNSMELYCCFICKFCVYWPFIIPSQTLETEVFPWPDIIILSHIRLDKMAAISQMTFSNAFSWTKIFVFWSKFHWSLFLRGQLTINQHWFR